MKRCPSCNGNFSDEQFFCPNCGVKLEEVRPEPKPRPQEDIGRGTSKPAKKSRRLMIFLIAALAAAVIAAGYFYCDASNGWRLSSYYEHRMQTVQSELEDAQSELENAQSKLRNAQSELKDAQRELEKVSDLIDRYGYGSERYYADKSVVVLSVNQTKDIPIYANMDATLYYTLSNSSGISGKWSQEWSDHKTTMQITGRSAGYYTVEFTTDADSTSFEVLVIVTG